MIIDTTVSIMEENMGKLRRLDQLVENKFRKKSGWHWPAERHARIQYRQAAIRDFLIKQGRECDFASNHVVFWKNGEIQDVQPLASPISKESQQVFSNAEKDKHFQKLIDKFETFMKFRISMKFRSSFRTEFEARCQRNPELLES